MADSRTLKLSILADTDDLVKGLKKAEGETSNAGNRIGDSFKKVGAAALAAGAVVGAFAIKLSVDAIKAASDLGETLSKTNVLFGKSSEAVIKFADSAASTFGQSKQQALDAASTFATFGRAAGLAGDDLVKFSTDFVGLASDLASFNNTSPEQAINAIGSALRGEAEPLRQFGVLLDDATLKNAALELGLISTTKNALTPQQKVLAAQKVIYEQTSAAQGDFARTSDGLANQQRILTAELANARVEIGEKLLPVAVDLFKFFNDRLVPILLKDVIPAVNNFIVEIQDLTIEINNNLKPSLDKFRDSAKDLNLALSDGKKITDDNKNSLSLLRTLFTEITSANLSGPLTFLTLFNDGLRITIDLLRGVASLLTLDFKNAFASFERALNPAIRQQEQLNAAAAEANRQFAAYAKVNNNVENSLASAYREFANQSRVIKDDLIPNLSSAIGLTGALSGANAALSGSTKGAAAAQSALARELAALRAGGAIPGAISPELRDFYKSELSLISQFGGIIPGINQKPGDPFFGFGEGSRVGGAIRGFESGNTQVVNINVSGAIVDPAGAARAVADVLKNETARSGTLVLTPNFAVE